MQVIKAVVSSAIDLLDKTETDREDTSLSVEEVKVRTLKRLRKYHSFIGRLIQSCEEKA